MNKNNNKDKIKQQQKKEEYEQRKDLQILEWACDQCLALPRLCLEETLSLTVS